MVRPLPDKRPVSKVAGPYGHPFHPLLVTLPIGAWVSSLVFDITSRISDQPFYAVGARWLVGIGVLGAVAAAVFGVMDFLTIPSRTRAQLVGLAHLTLNTLVVAAFAVSWFLRDDAGARTSLGLVVLSIAALAVLTVSGWLGGLLAYRYGVRVAREEDQRVGYDSARRDPESRRAA